MAILPKETQLSMKQILRTLFMLAFAGVLIMSVSSCSTLSDDVEGDNAKLYGTKWFNNEGSLGLEFESSDYAYFYYYSEPLGSGEFEYHASSGTIVFDSFWAIAGDPSQEIFEGRAIHIKITDAVLEGTRTMKVYFHESSNTDEYYMVLHKR